ncbi:hypothetical protein CSV73_08695 [Sporosarcina sp. P1]|nr:hypothetical protein CSV73_08695 [Sporosarcina sp. P1]
MLDDFVFLGVGGGLGVSCWAVGIVGIERIAGNIERAGVLDSSELLMGGPAVGIERILVYIERSIGLIERLLGQLEC